MRLQNKSDLSILFFLEIWVRRWRWASKKRRYTRARHIYVNRSRFAMQRVSWTLWVLEPRLFQSQLGQWLLLHTSLGSRVGGPDFSHCWAGEQLFPKLRADGGINTVIQRGFVKTKNKQARRCVLEGHVQAQHFRGQLADFSDFPSVCPVQGAEVHFAAISQDFRAWQKWSWRLPVILNQRGGSPRLVWRKNRDVFSDTYIWSVLLAWGSRPGGDADGSGRSYKLVVAENWKGQSCEAGRSETLWF